MYKMPKTDKYSFKKIAEQINNNCNNDIEKIRAMFDFVCYNIA